MTLTVLDYYKIKPEYLPPDTEWLSIYVRPGELESHVEMAECWELVGRTFHPNSMQIADIEHHGFCLRMLSV